MPQMKEKDKLELKVSIWIPASGAILRTADIMIEKKCSRVIAKLVNQGATTKNRLSGLWDPIHKLKKVRVLGLERNSPVSIQC